MTINLANPPARTPSLSNPDTFEQDTSAFLAWMATIAGQIDGQVLELADIEAGSNANGKYVRFPDGTQICWGESNLGSISANGSGTYTNPYHTNPVVATFAAAFSGEPSISLNAKPNGIQTLDRVLVLSAFSVTGEIIGSIRATNTAGKSFAADVIVTFMAVGRWS